MLSIWATDSRHDGQTSPVFGCVTLDGCCCCTAVFSNGRHGRGWVQAEPYVGRVPPSPKTLGGGPASNALQSAHGIMAIRRGVAQPGSAPALGAGCRRFKSCRPDHNSNGASRASEASRGVAPTIIPAHPRLKRPDRRASAVDLTNTTIMIVESTVTVVTWPQRV
jgi:hypothetical protein